MVAQSIEVIGIESLYKRRVRGTGGIMHDRLRKIISPDGAQV
jgi:hypothetical protein